MNTFTLLLESIQETEFFFSMTLVCFCGFSGMKTKALIILSPLLYLKIIWYASFNFYFRNINLTLTNRL